MRCDRYAPASPRVDYDLTPHVSCTEAPDRVGGLAQRETPVDDRSDRSALDEPCQQRESFRIAFRDERDDPPAPGERRQHHGLEQSPGWREPSSRRPADGDEDSVRFHDAPAVAERPGSADVEDDVPAVAAAGEVFGVVINDFVSTEGADDVGAPGTRHGSDVRAEPLRDLHGECPDAAAGTVDEHALRG